MSNEAFNKAMDEIDETARLHQAALAELIARLRREAISVENFSAQMRVLEERYNARMAELVRLARERSWAGVAKRSRDAP